MHHVSSLKFVRALDAGGLGSTSLRALPRRQVGFATFDQSRGDGTFRQDSAPGFGSPSWAEELGLEQAVKLLHPILRKRAESVITTVRRPRSSRRPRSR